MINRFKKYIVYAKYAVIFIVAATIYNFLSKFIGSFALVVALVVAYYLYMYLFENPKSTKYNLVVSFSNPNKKLLGFISLCNNWNSCKTLILLI